MKLHYLLLLALQTHTLDIEINGKVSFQLISNIAPGQDKGLRAQQLPDKESVNKRNEVSRSKHGVLEDAGSIESELGDLGSKESGFEDEGSKNTSVADILLLMVNRGSSNVTVGPMVECIYQYPESEQVNAIVSNMMNELTKVFVRASELIIDDDTRRTRGTRYRVVSKKNTEFFEDIYNNMTEEFTKFYKYSTKRVDRSGKNSDACKHQEKIKQLWKALLDNSLATFRRAALLTLEGHLKIQNRSSDMKSRGKLTEFLRREMSKVRSNQLDVLCDNFQLCYNELLK